MAKDKQNTILSIYLFIGKHFDILRYLDYYQIIIKLYIYSMSHLFPAHVPTFFM